MANIRFTQGATVVNGSGANSTEQTGAVTGQIGTVSIQGVTPGSYAWTVSGPPGSSPELSSSSAAAPTFTPETDYPGDYLLTLNGTYTLPLNIAKVEPNSYQGPVVPANLTPGQVAVPAQGTAISCDSTKAGALLATDSSGNQAPIAIARTSTTAARPTSGLYAGQPHFDTTLGKPIWRNAANSGWIDATGASV